MNQSSSRKSKFFSQSKHQSPLQEESKQLPEPIGHIEEFNLEKPKPPEKRPSSIHAQAVFNTLRKFNVSKVETYSTIFQKTKGIFQPSPGNKERRESIKSPKLLKEYKYRKTITSSEDPRFKLDSIDLKGSPFFSEINSGLEIPKPKDPKEQDQASNSGEIKTFERTNSMFSYGLSSYYGEDGSEAPENEGHDSRKHRNQQVLRKVLLGVYFLGILYSEQNRARIFGSNSPRVKESQEKKAQKPSWLPLFPGHPFSIFFNISQIGRCKFCSIRYI